MLAPQFFGMGANTMINLQDIFATGDDIEDNVTIQFLDSYGVTTNSVMWSYGPGLDNPTAEDRFFWSTTDWDHAVEGVTLKPGTGLYVAGISDLQGIQTSGEVGQQDVTVRLCNGSTATGNPFPVPVDLQDVLADGDDIEDNVTIQFLDEYGVTTNSVMWSYGPGLDNPTAEDRFFWSTTDWDHAVEGVTLKPGEGIYVGGISDTQYIVFPHPELKD